MSFEKYKRTDKLTDYKPRHQYIDTGTFCSPRYLWHLLNFCRKIDPVAISPGGHMSRQIFVQARQIYDWPFLRETVFRGPYGWWQLARGGLWMITIYLVAIIQGWSLSSAYEKLLALWWISLTNITTTDDDHKEICPTQKTAYTGNFYPDMFRCTTYIFLYQIQRKTLHNILR